MEKVDPIVGTDDSRTDLPKRGSLASILNPDGSIRRDLPGSYDTRGYSIAPGVDGAPRFFTDYGNTKQSVVDACGDNWDDRFGGSNGLNGEVLAIAVAPDGDVIVGGTFTQAGGITVNRIARWDGLRWSALGGGVNNDVHVIEIHSTPNSLAYALYIGGKFTQAGNASANRIARWTGSQWAAMGNGMNGTVHALLLSERDGDLYAGGEFTTAGFASANRIARWDGSAWTTLGFGLESAGGVAVYALADTSSAILVGGQFTSAGGVSTTGLARWTGILWTAGPSINGVVRDISVDSFGMARLAGTFADQSLGHVVRWSTALQSWQPLPGWGLNGSVNALQKRQDSPSNETLIGGLFTEPGNRVARIVNDSPTTLGGGIAGAGGRVSALSVTDDAVYVGGAFSTAGCRPSAYFAKYFDRNFRGSEFSGDWHDPALWSIGSIPTPTSSANIGFRSAGIVNANAQVKELRIDNGQTLTVGAGRDLQVNGNLNIKDGFINGEGQVRVLGYFPEAIYGGGPNGFISTLLARQVGLNGQYHFPVGSSGQYAGVIVSDVSATSGVGVKPNSGQYTLSATGLSGSRLRRWWKITGLPTTATVKLHYNDSEVVGPEAAYRVFVVNPANGSTLQLPTVIDTVDNTATVTGVNIANYSDWTLADASGPPTVSTRGPLWIGLTQAELSAEVNPNGYSTTLWWRFSTVDPGTCNDSFGEVTPHFNVGSGLDPFNYSQTNGSFSPATTYYYCAIASNSAGTVYGSILSFTTLPPTAPSVTTGEPTSITTSSAILQGIATPNGAQTIGWFRYSSTDPGTCNDSFGIRTPPTGGTNVGSGTVQVNYSETVSGLLPSTLYYFCPIAENSIGKTYGPVVTFLTKAVRVVDNPSDEVVLGGCTAAPDDCTLRGAVLGAMPGDEIRFLSPLFDSPQTITLVGGTIPVMRSTNITGPGAQLLTVTGGSFFTILDGVPDSPTSLTISGMRLSGGVIGGIRFQGSQQGKSLTATSMIFEGHTNQGAVVVGPGSQGTFVNSTFRKNTAFPLMGGAITGQVNSTVLVNGCTFHENFGSETIRAYSATIENSTIHDNSGRGLFIEDSGVITSTTITVNGSGVHAGGTGTTVRNSIIASNSNIAGDVEGIFTSDGYNLIGNVGSVSTFNQLGDQVGSSGAPLNPMLGPLFDNGGITFTRVPVVGSPVIDRGNAFGLLTDQRGNLRPVDIGSIPNVGDGSDIGAFEVQAPTAAGVTVGGRVLTSSGIGIARSIVMLTDQAGQTRTVQTNTFGYYRFDSVPAGGTFVLAVSAKGYSFTVQVIDVLDDIGDMNFVAVEVGLKTH